MAGLTLCVTFEIPEVGIAEFQDYEACVLPLLAGHGGVLQRRLRSADGRFEMHIVHFDERHRFEEYRQDPRRASLAPLMTASGVVARVLEVEDVP